MKLIDVNAGFGGRESIQRFTPEMMLEQLARIPSGLAFVHCRTGALDPGVGNDQVLELCRSDARLRPIAAIHPRDTFLWRGELERCLAAGVRVFRIDPVMGEWPVDSVFLHDVVAKLSGAGVVLMVDATRPGLPSTVAEATAAAGLPVIFTDARYFPLSELLPVAERYPNVFIETGRVTSPDGIELCVKTLGADRLLFGSGTARYPAWQSWQVLERADITEDEREAIAWRNAARLLEVEPIAVNPPVQSQAASGPFIDVHLHDRFPGGPLAETTPESYASEMQRLGVAHGVSSSVGAIFYDLARGNDEQAELLTRLPQLRGYVVVDPRYYDDSVHELRRLETDDRFVGVKIHCSYARTLTHAPRLRRLFAVLAEYGKPVLIHPLGEEWPEALVELAGEHPHLPIIAAHAGYGDGPHPTHDAAMRVASAPNIFIEFCSTYLAVGAIRRGIEAVGVERVLFGSDYPLISIRSMQIAYEEADLTEDEADAIYSRNARRLFPAFQRP